MRSKVIGILHHTQIRRRRVRWLLACALLLGIGAQGCWYSVGPLPLGTTNNARAESIVTRHTWAEPVELPGLPNLHRVSDDLYRGAQPTPDGMRRLERLGIKTIVNLRSSDTDRDKLGDVDLAYVRIPMTAWQQPCEDDVVRFLEIVTDPAASPVFLHCRRGADRTGALCAAYRLAVQGWDKDEAVAEMTRGGFRFYSGWQNLVRYLRDLDVEQLRRRAGLDRKAD